MDIKPISTNPLITAFLAVARALKVKGELQWPREPREVARDSELQAQLAFDLAYAVHHIWTRNLSVISEEAENEWKGREGSLWSAELPGAAKTAYQRLRNAQENQRQRQIEFDTQFDIAKRLEERLDASYVEKEGRWESKLPDAADIEAHPDILLLRERDESLLAARHESAQAKHELIEQTSPGFTRKLSRERLTLLKQKARICHESQRFFGVNAQAVMAESLYGEILYKRDPPWLGGLCARIAVVTKAKRRFSVSAYGFRVSYKSILASINSDVLGSNKKLPATKKEAFRIWIEKSGLLAGLSLGDDFHSLEKTCLEQENEVRDFFERLGFGSFDQFLESGRKFADQKLRSILAEKRAL